MSKAAPIADRSDKNRPLRQEAITRSPLVPMSKNVLKLTIPRRGNETIEDPLDTAEEAAMIAAAAQKLGELLDVLRIDHRNDHNTRDTPMRVAKMYVKEFLRGRFTAPPTITDFVNAERYDQLIVTGPIDVRSICAHHLMPIY